MSDYPIPTHETWDVLDSTKIQTFLECPRKYFYEYMLGWRRRSGNLHLNFGSAIHSAMEHFNHLRKQNGKGYRLTDQDIADAVIIFTHEYRENHPEDEDEWNKPKDLETGKLAIVAYAEEYDRKDSNEEVLFPETTGVVLIDVERVVHFKCDIIAEDDRGIFARDYKTAQRKSDLWAMDFELRIQIGTYIHAARCMFPDRVNDVWGLEVRGIFLYKAMNKDRKYGKVDFWDVPIRKDPSMMEVWRQSMVRWTDTLFKEMELLQECDAEEPVLRAFPMNTTSCTNYGGCPYHDFCTVWPNPLSRCQKVPMDYEVRFWDPRVQSENY